MNKHDLLFLFESEKQVHSTVDLSQRDQSLLISDNPKNPSYGRYRSLAKLIRVFKEGASWGKTHDRDGALKEVGIGGKKLYLTGVSVVQHLSGETISRWNIVTEATSDEIMKILSEGQYTKTDLSLLLDAPTSQTYARSGGTFYINAGGRVYQLQPLVGGTLENDAKTRRYTVEAMFLELTNPDGENKVLHDFYGGLLHFVNQRLVPINNNDQPNDDWDGFLGHTSDLTPKSFLFHRTLGRV